MDQELNKAIRPEPINTLTDLLEVFFEYKFPGTLRSRDSNNNLIIVSTDRKCKKIFYTDHGRVRSYIMAENIITEQEIENFSEAETTKQMYKSILEIIYGSGTK